MGKLHLEFDNREDLLDLLANLGILSYTKVTEEVPAPNQVWAAGDALTTTTKGLLTLDEAVKIITPLVLGKSIEAISLLRRTTAMGLKDAKDEIYRVKADVDKIKEEIEGRGAKLGPSATPPEPLVTLPSPWVEEVRSTSSEWGKTYKPNHWADPEDK